MPLRKRAPQQNSGRHLYQAAISGLETVEECEFSVSRNVRTDKVKEQGETRWICKYKCF